MLSSQHHIVDAAQSLAEEAEIVDDGGEMVEAWSPFDDSSKDSKAPCNSPEDSGILSDNWGWGDLSDEESPPPPIQPPTLPPRKDPIARTLFPVAMTTCGGFLATAFAQQTGRTWTGALTIHDFTSTPRLTSSNSLAVSPSGVALCDAGSVLVALDDGSLCQLELNSDGHVGMVKREHWEHDLPISALAISRGGTRAFSCDVSGMVCVWDALVVLHKLMRRPSPALSAPDATLTAHPDLERLFASAGGCRIRLWEDEKVVRTLNAVRRGSSITSLLWAQSDTLLLGWSDGCVQKLDLRAAEVPVWTVGGGGRTVLGMTVPTSDQFAAITADNCLRLLAEGKETEKWPLSTGTIWDCRCEDSLVTDLTKLPGGGVLACCRNQTWFHHNEGTRPEELDFPLPRPEAAVPPISSS